METLEEQWKGLEPAPLEYLHGLLMEKFHEFRKGKTKDVNVTINGNELNNIIAKSKVETYEKYKALNLRKAIPSDLLLRQNNYKTETQILNALKISDAENYVDWYIDNYGKPPTYRQVAVFLKIAVCAAHNRLRFYREKMKTK